MVQPWDLICLEELTLKSPAKTKQAKSWMNASRVSTAAEYKPLWNGKHFVRAGKFLPSTKLCSEREYKNDNLSLSDRERTCPACGTDQFRDWNAAKNIRAEGLGVGSVKMPSAAMPPQL
jgi:putative transposase